MIDIDKVAEALWKADLHEGRPWSTASIVALGHYRMLAGAAIAAMGLRQQEDAS